MINLSIDFAFSSMTHSLKLLDISGNQFGELPLEAIKNIHTLSRLEAHRYDESHELLYIFLPLILFVCVFCFGRKDERKKTRKTFQSSMIVGFSRFVDVTRALFSCVLCVCSVSVSINNTELHR